MQEGAAFTAMAAVTTSGSEMSAKTLTGDITFYQNPLTLNNAKYHVNLPNVAANTPIGIYIHAAGGGCDDTAATATTITVSLSYYTTSIFSWGLDLRPVLSQARVMLREMDVQKNHSHFQL